MEHLSNDFVRRFRLVRDQHPQRMGRSLRRFVRRLREVDPKRPPVR